MQIILIAAITMDGYIAKNSAEVILWSKDLKLFKEQTMGYPVIMGSNTEKTLATELSGRQKIVIHRNTDPEKTLLRIKTSKCFVIGGGMTNTKFIDYLTHLYLTPHPNLFGDGIKIFNNINVDLNLNLKKAIPVDRNGGIYQLQYEVVR